jgi:hypothetical protein
VNPIVALATAAIWNDEFAKFVRAVAWGWLAVIATWLAADSLVQSSELTGIQLAWLACASAIGAAYWYRDRSWQRLVSAMISCTALLVSAMRRYCPAIDDSVLGPGLPWLAWGTAALWVAILVSLGKTGLLARLAQAFRRFGDGRFGIHPGN